MAHGPDCCGGGCGQVRDRATLQLNVLGGDGEESVATEGAQSFMLEGLGVPLVNLENSLRSYVRNSNPIRRSVGRSVGGSVGRLVGRSVGRP